MLAHGADGSVRVFGAGNQNSQLWEAKAMKKCFKKTTRPRLKKVIGLTQELLKEEEEEGIGVYEDQFGSEWAEYIKQYDIYHLNLLSHAHNKNLEKALKYEKKIRAMAKAPCPDNYDYYTDAAMKAATEMLDGMENTLHDLRETLEAEKVIKRHKEAAAKRQAKAVKGKGKKGRGKK